MTGAIIYTGLIGVYGFIIGKSFKGLNPFLMFIGLMFALPVIAYVEQYQQPLLYIPFAIGFITNFASPLRSVMDFFSGIKMDIERFFANKLYKKEQKRKEKEHAKEYKKEQAKENARRAKQAKQQAKQNKRKSTNQTYQNQQNNNYSEQQRQAQAEQERLRRQAEELRRQREQFQREQAQAKNNQTNHSSSPNEDLDPNNLDDACEILGCNRNDDLATFKKAYRVLRAMYHPDKVEQFGGRRKKQAEEEMKLINLAWARVQKKFR